MWRLEDNFMESVSALTWVMGIKTWGIRFMRLSYLAGPVIGLLLCLPGTLDLAVHDRQVLDHWLGPSVSKV